MSTTTKIIKGKLREALRQEKSSSFKKRTRRAEDAAMKDMDDKKLSTKLMSNDVKYVAVMALHNGSNEWGWFGLLYNRENDIPSEKEILNEMMVASQSITKTLSTIK